MIVDTSALVAILQREQETDAFTRLVVGAPVVRLSAASYVELAAVVDGRGDRVTSGALDSFLRRWEIEIVPFTPAQARIARDAYQRFGRGSGHPARLNMGDCFAYALARDLGEPLLFKGRDFALTDIEIALEPDPRKRLSEVVAAYVAGGV
ncbi:MAG: type II toxin-antitoxin system VapC family toxin, partial [Chloroflexi bacterium]|nr:type II toxin-antitoxin system VapC family toxin [Chloroflexota bacterium]